MTNITPKQYYDRYTNAPSEIQNIMDSLDVGKFILSKGKEYGVPEEKISLLSREIGLVLLGFEHEKDMSKNIQEKFGLKESYANKLANNISGVIFQKVEGVLRGYSPISRKEIDSKTKKELLSPVTKLRISSGNEDNSLKIRKFMSSLIKDNNIHIDQAGIIENIINKTIDGEITSKDFTQKINSIEGLSKEDTLAVINKIDEQIFKNIVNKYKNKVEDNEKKGQLIGKTEILNYREQVPQNITQPQNNLSDETPEASIPDKYTATADEGARVDNVETTSGDSREKLYISGVSDSGKHSSVVKDLMHKKDKENFVSKKLKEGFVIKSEETKQPTGDSDAVDIKRHSSYDPYREPIE